MALKFNFQKFMFSQADNEFASGLIKTNTLKPK